MQKTANWFRVCHVMPSGKEPGARTPANILFIKKFAAFFLTIAFINVYATGVAQNITFSGKLVPLKQVFHAIEKQTGYIIVLNQKDLDLHHQVSLNVSNMPLKDFMRIVLKDEPVNFILEDKNIYLSPKPAPAATDSSLSKVPGVIRGVVHGTDGKPAQSVTVRIKGENGLAITNENGEFSIRVLSQKATLIFTGVNFETLEAAAVPGSDLRAYTLRSRIMQLKDVTVEYNTGYQTLNKERATGSFGKPDMEVFHDRVGTNDIVGRLEGQVAGLSIGTPDNVVTTNGNGVSTRSSLVRGSSTTPGLGGTSEPLYVVNGVVVNDFASINPDDIQDITVLKDAAAAAIWGARAANGVLVIVTKSGKARQALTINYSGSINLRGKPDLNYIPVMTSRQFIETAKEIFDPVANTWNAVKSGFVAPHDQILYDQYQGLISTAQANASLDSLGNINNLGQIKDIWYRNAMITNHTLSVSGGTEVYNFYGSLGWIGAQSNTPGDHNNTYRISLSQNVKAGKRLSITLNTTLINTVTNGDNGISVDNTYLPYQLFRDAAGNSINMPYMVGYGDSLRQNYAARSLLNMDYDPIKERRYGHHSSNNLNVNVTANVELKIWKGLSFLGTYSYIKGPGTSDNYSDARMLSQRQKLLSFTKAPYIGATPEYLLPADGGTYVMNNYDQRNWTVRNQLAYVASPRQGKDVVNLQAGTEAAQGLTYSTSNTLYGYKEGLGTYALLDYATLSQGVSGTIRYGYFNQPFEISQALTRFNSWFALGSYTLDHKYSLDLSWRQDHSNLFGSDVSSQNKPIYSIGGKWQLAREHFLENISWLNTLSLRATYGITGNSPYVGAASYSDILGAHPASETGGIAGDALRVESPANRKVSWESTHTTNIGIDFAVLKQRLSGTIEVYNKKTTDLLANVPANPLNAFSSTLGNLGDMSNKGIEFTIHSENLRLGNFSWSTNFVFGHNVNKLIRLGDADFPTASGYYMSTHYVVGRSLYPMYAFRFAGLDNMGDPQIKLGDGNTVTKTPSGTTIADLVYKGTTIPPYYGGLTNNFRYKGLTLGVNMVYNLGHVMRRDVNEFYTGRLGGSTAFKNDNITPDFLRRWKQPGDEKITDIPSYVADYTNYSRRNTNYYTQGDINVVSASYVKIRDLTLGYDLAPSVLRMLKVKRINVYGQATNFMVWKANHDGIDPEYVRPGDGTMLMPPSKHSYSFGLNVTL